MTDPQSWLRGLTCLTKPFHRVMKDRRGNFATFFAISLPVLIPGIGIGVDMARLMALKQDLQHSVDATTQTITQRLNLCLDKKRTQSGTQGQVQDQDTGCLNDAQYTTALKSTAQALLSTNFTQKGYSSPPTIVGDVVLNQITGQMKMAATVSYHCFFMRMLNAQLCNAAASSDGNLSNAFAQGLPLRINVDPNVKDLWAEDQTQPNLPFNIGASDGWKPYTFIAGANMPLGLTLKTTSDVTAAITGTPKDVQCDTANCAPQNLPPTTISVMDNGDANRSNSNRQTDVGYARFRLIHVLKVTSLDGIVGEDGQKDQATGTDVRPGVFTYGVVPVVSGGLAPYTYACSGAPQGVGSVGQFTCNDDGSGRIKGMPLLNAGQAVVQGTYTITVTDARGKTATGTKNYIYRIPPFTAYGGNITGVYGKPMSTGIVFGADGGYGFVKATCSNLPPGLSCNGQGYDSDPNGGTGRWGYFEGTIVGSPADDAPSSGVFYATLSDAAGRSQTVPITYSFTRPTTIGSYDYFDCTTNYAIVGTVNAIYNSVHDKFGSNIPGVVNVSCGSSATGGQGPTYMYGPWGIVNGVQMQGPKYGDVISAQMISPTQMQSLVDTANSICSRMATDTAGQFEGRQGDVCTGTVSIADVTKYGRFNSAQQQTPPQLCYRWRSQDGWGFTQSRVIICTDQNGGTIGSYSW